MLQKRTIEIAVGTFFLLGIAAFAMLAIKVSGLSGLYTAVDTYTVTADFDNIGGLKPRARVTMAGVTIGRVVDIHFDPQTYVARVTLHIDDDVDHIPEDSRASILTSGLLGDNYIGLTAGFSDQFFKNNSHISANDTDGAIVLEQLVEKFLSGKASGLENPEAPEHDKQQNNKTENKITE